MAQKAKITLGIDVSKDKLDIYQWDKQQHWQIANEAEAITELLSGIVEPLQIAAESTSSYHLELVEQAHALGIELFLVNPRQLANYRKAIGKRNKTDASDAYLLARYLDRERDQLHRFRPPSAKAQRLWTLIKRRAKVVEMTKQLRQSLAPVMTVSAALRALNQLLIRIDQRCAKLIAELGWRDQYQRCRAVPGIGAANATALVCAFHRGAFASANAFIAYLGLDVRLRESGKFKGQRKLTKQGEPELRRLLYCAAIPSRSYAPFAAYHQLQLDKGLPKIAANVVLARKLARIAFALMRDRTDFVREPCMAP